MTSVDVKQVFDDDHVIRVAVIGCLHGKLKDVYASVRRCSEEACRKVDFVVITGDFQAFRDEKDMDSAKIKPKYRDMGTFHEFFDGMEEAPVPTLCVGGNHESSAHFMEFPWGGWLAPNVYYMGFAGCVRFGPLRIGGVSGIFMERDYHRPRYETLPLSMDEVRSIYHTRSIDIARMMKLPSSYLDIMITHDWPTCITSRDNAWQLKPGLHADASRGKLGNPHFNQLLAHQRPMFWFSSHLHQEYARVYEHIDPTSAERVTLDGITRFLALDKVEPRRSYLKILDIPIGEDDVSDTDSWRIAYDPEWMFVTSCSHHVKNEREMGFLDDTIDATEGRKKKFNREMRERAQSMGYSFDSFGNILIPNDAFERYISTKEGEMHPQTRKLFQLLDIE